MQAEIIAASQHKAQIKKAETEEEKDIIDVEVIEPVIDETPRSNKRKKKTENAESEEHADVTEDIDEEKESADADLKKIIEQAVSRKMAARTQESEDESDNNNNLMRLLMMRRATVRIRRLMVMKRQPYTFIPPSNCCNIPRKKSIKML